MLMLAIVNGISEQLSVGNQSKNIQKRNDRCGYGQELAMCFFPSQKGSFFHHVIFKPSLTSLVQNFNEFIVSA